MEVCNVGVVLHVPELDYVGVSLSFDAGRLRRFFTGIETAS